MKLPKLLVLLTVGILMTSCLKTDEQTSGTGDAIVVIKKSGTDTVYGISFHARTFSAFKSVTVVDAADPSKTYTLSAFPGYKTYFYYETPDTEYSTTPPAATTYNFSAVFENGATQNFLDVLSDKLLAVPSIAGIAYNATTNAETITWPALPNANTYAITIMDGTTNVFGSVELANSVTSYSISSSGGGWTTGTLPVKGKTYTVRLFAFLYEAGINTDNVQATAIGETTMIWGN